MSLTTRIQASKQARQVNIKDLKSVGWICKAGNQQHRTSLPPLPLYANETVTSLPS